MRNKFALSELWFESSKNAHVVVVINAFITG
jgi:hypothetical protein